MFSFKGLHAIAAHRRDGLRQEFLELFSQREALGAANVEELSAHFADHLLQAGPNPVGATGSTLPDGVLPFSRDAANSAVPATSNTPTIRRNI